MIFYRIIKAALLMLLFFCQNISAQEKYNTVVESGSILKLKDGTVLIGELQNYGEGTPYKIKLITNDIVTVDAKYLKRFWLPNDIRLFSKSRFNFKEGLILNFKNSFSEDHGCADLTVGKLFKDKYEIGAGIGIHGNSFSFSSSTANYWINVTSLPVYLNGKYYLSSGFVKWYAHASAGLANNLNTFQFSGMRNGFMGQLGLGTVFASKSSAKFIMELSQYYSSAKGRYEPWDANAIGDVNFKIGFNRFRFTLGMAWGF